MNVRDALLAALRRDPELVPKVKDSLRERIDEEGRVATVLQAAEALEPIIADALRKRPSRIKRLGVPSCAGRARAAGRSGPRAGRRPGVRRQAEDRRARGRAPDNRRRLLGHDVNLAARLLDHCKPDRVVSEAAKELAERRLKSVDFASRRAVKIRGLTGRTTIYTARPDRETSP